MFRSASTVEMLKPIALIAAISIILWSVGLPSLGLVQAASVTDLSDVITDSAPSAVATHTITYTATDGVEAGDSIIVDLTGFDASLLDHTAIALSVGGAPQTVAAAPLGATWGASFVGSVLTIESDTAVVNENDEVIITIDDLVNPAAEGSYPIQLESGATDTGETRVVILTAVTVSATVNTIFTFSVEGLASGVTVNGNTTTGTAGSTSIPFGVLEAGVASTAAQMLTVETNAANGYVVTVQADQPFQSSTGADIDLFDNGADATNPTAWGSPDGIVNSEATYGHWGLTSDDTDIDSRTTNQFGNDLFIAVGTDAREIMQHDGPVNGEGVGVGTTTVAYKVEITALQEAADDYSTTLTYIATPTF